MPERAIALGVEFDYPDIDSALKNLLSATFQPESAATNSAPSAGSATR